MATVNLFGELALDASVTDVKASIDAQSKAEDTAHVSGDIGVPALAVRIDDDVSLAGTYGDYSMLQVNEFGHLKAAVRGANYDLVEGEISNSGQHIIVDLSGAASVFISMKNTGPVSMATGTFVFSARIEPGGEYFTVQMARTNANIVETQTSLPTILAGDGLPYGWKLATAGYYQLRISCTNSVTATSAANFHIQRSAMPVEPIPISQVTATQPVSAASLPLPTGAATEASTSALNAKVTTATSIPDNQSQGIIVRPVGQDTWVTSFSDVGSSLISNQFRAPDVGTGVGYSQAAGSLLITTGTTTNAEFLTRSTTAWRGTMQMRYSFVASQRIANQNFAILLADLVGENLSVTINSATSITVALPGHAYTSANVGQFMFVGGISGAAGVPGRYAIASVVAGTSINFTVAGWPASGSCTADVFGHSAVKHIYNGTTATSMLADAQRKGWASGDSTLTINTTASPGHIMQAHLAGREVFWHDSLRATSTTANMTSRGSRFESIPDDNLDLYLWVWSYNGTTAPASTTTWTLGFASVEKFANFPVYLQGSEMQGTTAPAPVQIVGTVTTTASGTVTANQGTLVAPTASAINSAATTNATSVKATAGTVYSVTASNINAAARYVKLYNLATAPTVGTSTPVLTIPIPPGSAVNISFGATGYRFATGIGLAITGAAADSDTTAVAANEIKVITSYI
jgi:hypothetical protein